MEKTPEQVEKIVFDWLIEERYSVRKIVDKNSYFNHSATDVQNRVINVVQDKNSKDHISILTALDLAQKNPF